MQNEENLDFSSFIKDTAIVLVGVTALAYFFGWAYHGLYWRMIGLSPFIHPEVTKEEILVRGGVVVSITFFLTFVPYYYWNDIRKKWGWKKTGKSFLSPMQRRLWLILTILYVSAAVILFYAWKQTYFLKNELMTVQNINIDSASNLNVSEPLYFIGKTGNFMIFCKQRVLKADSIVLIAESEIKSFDLIKKPQQKNPADPKSRAAD